MELWTHKILNCPPPPDKFIRLALNADPTQIGPQSVSNLYAPGKDYIASRKLIADNTNIPLVRIPRFDLNDEFNKWVKENIFTNFFESAIAISEHTKTGKYWRAFYDAWKESPEKFNHVEVHGLIDSMYHAEEIEQLLGQQSRLLKSI